MSKYVAISQHEDSEEEDRRTATSTPSFPPRRFGILYSPLILGSLLVVLLAANIICFSITTQMAKGVFEALRSRDIFTDTRDLPRPDQYDGLQDLHN